MNRTPIAPLSCALALGLALAVTGCSAPDDKAPEVEAAHTTSAAPVLVEEQAAPEPVDIVAIDNEVLTVVVHGGEDLDATDYRFDYDVSITNHTEDEIELDLVEGSLQINGTPVTSSWPFMCPPLSPGETAKGPCFSIEYFEGYASPESFRGATISGDLVASTGWWDWDGAYQSEELGTYHFEFSA